MTAFSLFIEGGFLPVVIVKLYSGFPRYVFLTELGDWYAEKLAETFYGLILRLFGEGVLNPIAQKMGVATRGKINAGIKRAETLMTFSPVVGS